MTTITKRLILIKVEYHGQVWYEVKEQEITMGITHANYAREANLSKAEVLDIRETSAAQQP